jgi:hypothetical protein
VSSRHTRSFFGVMLAVVFALSAVIVAPASAKLTKSQKAHMRHQLRKQIKKNPKLIRSKSFIKKASLVNFKLPVTIRLRNSASANNPNSANVDLGTSLGQREVYLGGSLAAEIVFHDSFDGGALGNVDINILPSATKSLTSTSIPLLWNTQVTQLGSSYDSNLLALGGAPHSLLDTVGHAPGCGDINSTNPNLNANGDLGFGIGFLNSDGSPHFVPNPTPPPPVVTSGDGLGLPGVPIYDTFANAGNAADITGFAPAAVKGALAFNNGTDAVKASKVTGDSAANPTLNNNVGGNPDPFPQSAQSDPGADGTTGQPTAADTVLRTNALKLNIATAGTEVDQADNVNGVAGSQNLVMGASGGQANLFGNIPGKSYGIDVTVNLATKINSILRVVDQDANEPLFVGGNWPAAVFTCAQVWTGAVQNYIPAVHLQGSLKIAPGITSDGHLRIAKATIAQLGDPTQFAVSACLMPNQAYNTEAPANLAVPAGGTVGAPAVLTHGQLPASPDSIAPAPSATCNSAPSALVANSALPPSTVTALSPAAGADGYTVTNSGSTVSVAAGLDVQNVSADVLIGDV